MNKTIKKFCRNCFHIVEVYRWLSFVRRKTFQMWLNRHRSFYSLQSARMWKNRSKISTAMTCFFAPTNCLVSAERCFFVPINANQWSRVSHHSIFTRSGLETVTQSHAAVRACVNPVPHHFGTRMLADRKGKKLAAHHRHSNLSTSMASWQSAAVSFVSSKSKHRCSCVVILYNCALICYGDLG